MNKMIPVRKVYDATRQGLDIILWIYPQAAECVGVKGKKFKVRDGKTPSACLHRRKSEKYGDIWGVMDYGGEGWRSAIHLYMEDRHLSQDRFNEAVLQIAAHFNVTDEQTAGEYYFIKVKDCLSGTVKGKKLAEFLLKEFDGIVIPCQTFHKEVDSVIAAKVDELDSLYPDVPFIMKSSFKIIRCNKYIENLFVYQQRLGASVEFNLELVKHVKIGGAL